MVPDKVETGTIKSQTYRAYVEAAGGYFVALLILLIFMLNVGSTAFSSWWLAHWIKSGGGVRIHRQCCKLSPISVFETLIAKFHRPEFNHPQRQRNCVLG